MTVKQGSFGRVRVFDDFLAPVVTAPTTSFTKFGNIGAIATAAATIAQTVDDGGGICTITTDGTDDYNCAVYAGVFKPANGGCVMEARFKIASVTTSAIFCGFSETLAVTTPVMPVSATGANVLTCAGSGGVVGMLFDPDCTAPDLWLAVAGDAAVEETVYPATEGITATYWNVVRVEISADKGDGSCYLNGKLIHTFPACVTTTDVEHAILMVSNRTSAASVLAIDYFYAEGGRDWADD